MYLAYLDPGSGNMLAAALVAGFAGAAVAIKVWWRRLRSKFRRSPAGQAPAASAAERAASDAPAADAPGAEQAAAEQAAAEPSVSSTEAGARVVERDG